MRKRLVFITNQLPYPPRSGGVIKSWRLLRRLADAFDVVLIAPLKGEDEQYLAEMKAALPGVEVHCAPVERPRTGLNFLRSLVMAPTLNVYRTACRQLHHATAQAIARADLVLVDHLEVFPYVPAQTAIPVVLHQHNAEFVMWERSKKVARNMAERVVLAIETQRVKRFERQACLRADLVFAAPNDQEELAKLGVPKERFHTTFHLGDDSGLYAPALQFHAASDNLLYVGTLSWPANADGLLWFLSAVWPGLKSAHPALTLDIIGRGASAELETAVAHATGAQLHGFVDDLEPFYQKSKVFIAPLRFGSGTKVKVITALYRGLPCVTTTVGAEGLALVNGQEIFLADDADGTAKSIHTLLTNSKTWETLRDQGRSKAKNELGWNPLLDDHVQSLRSLLPPQGP
ncbi:MAG: glycosyltransferase [Flavobacteriales bacterium]|nr:glycosyltransferase [Flavobacteriales bacterium]